MNIACLLPNASVLELVRVAVGQAGGACVNHSSEVALFRALSRQAFDLVIVDFELAPSVDDTILSWLNCRSGNETPVLGLSPQRDAGIAALVLDSGADDLMVRPFEPVELVARARALIRRSSRRTVRRKIDVSGFSLDRESSTLSFEGAAIALTPREFSLAWMFFSSIGVYISRDTIGTSLWGADSEVAGRTIEQHVYKLRKKLRLGAERGVILRTVYGQGYRLGLIGRETPDADVDDDDAAPPCEEPKVAATRSAE